MADSPLAFTRRVPGVVRLRQLIDQTRHRLSFVPGVYVLASIGVAQIALAVDRRIDLDGNPFTTSVDGAQAVFAAIAGGLITAITLVLSMMLVAVQLASSQFSPRTLRDWLSDSVLKHTIGLALGTAVFSLMALRSTGTFAEAERQVVPNLSVVIALVLAVMSLFAVVQSVDHITHSLRIGSVARRLTRDTIGVVETTAGSRAGQDPRHVPASRVWAGGLGNDDESDVSSDEAIEVPDGAAVIEAPHSGWIQQIEVEVLFEELPEDSTAWVVVPLGGFIPAGTPMMWIDPPLDDEEVQASLLEAFAVGDTRTMQQDVAFGIMQLSDIAVRAMSPGINDPNSAADIVVHLGDVLLALWSEPEPSALMERDGRRLVQRQTRHSDHLSRAIDPIRRYARADPHVLSTIVATLQLVRDETVRRSLPGPVEPLDVMIGNIGALAERDSWSTSESEAFDRFLAG